MKKNILVTGANGQLGNELKQLSQNHNQFHWIFTTRAELDIAQEEKVRSFFNENPIDICINAAAYTAVDKAESEKEMAFAVNETGVKNLAIECAEKKIKFIHLSTDFIFDGSKPVPLKEDDIPNPTGVYAASKLGGEKAALQYCPAVIIIRTSWVYSTFGKNFVNTMLQLGESRPALSIVFDQVGTPTYAADLALAILKIIEQSPGNEMSGIYHYSNEGAISWYDFAKAIFEIKKISCVVSPIETYQYPTPAKRPAYSVLNKKKIRETFGIEIPYWKDSLKKCLDQM